MQQRVGIIFVGVLLAVCCATAAEYTGPVTIPRDGLPHCRVAFEKEKQGRVAYIGGSITASPGWRDTTCEYLKKRFPETSFDFINAGVGGTNSTFGAFRLVRDVFAKGRVDLLFLEFAVNDGNDEAPGNRCTRAMEGIVRHARALNPNIDILMMHFADTSKVELFRAGTLPGSIALHERVAERYGLPSLNLALEVTRRLDAGAFTWEQFSRDTCHPAELGHALYTECISAYLDAAWSAPLGEMPAFVALPAPLDAGNYEHGRFLPVQEAKVLGGWEYLPSWDTPKKCNYGGAVAVLAGTKPGDALELTFEGTIIGISAIAGMDAGQLLVRVDDAPETTVELFDNYCPSFHRPVCHILAEDLAPGKHTLRLTIGENAQSTSEGHAARILDFVAN